MVSATRKLLPLPAIPISVFSATKSAYGFSVLFFLLLTSEVSAEHTVVLPFHGAVAANSAKILSLGAFFWEGIRDCDIHTRTLADGKSHSKSSEEQREKPSNQEKV